MLLLRLCTLRSVFYLIVGHVASTVAQVFEEYQGFLEKYGDLRYCARWYFQTINRLMFVPVSVIPTRYFLGRPDIGEEMHISIEKGKTLIIRLMAVGPVVEGRAQRDVWFEVNGEVYRFTIDLLHC
jgi:pyruvate carboxylase